MTTITARLSLAGGIVPGQDIDLDDLTGQEVDLWECHDAAVPLGLVTVEDAAYELHNDALVLTLRVVRLVCGDRSPEWLTDGATVDVSTRYEWIAPGLLRLHSLAHTTPLTPTIKEQIA